jgi:hypothetical protein
MADNFGSGKGSNKTTTGLHKGLSNKAAKWPDSSTGPRNSKGKGAGSVNNDTTRSSTARTPRSLGPRTA